MNDTHYTASGSSPPAKDDDATAIAAALAPILDLPPRDPPTPGPTPEQRAALAELYLFRRSGIMTSKAKK